jgi:hypothetical protein
MPQTFARLFEKLVAFYDDTGQPRTTPETERDTLIPIRTRRAIESRFSSGKRCRKESFDSESVVDRAWFPAATTKADPRPDSTVVRDLRELDLHHPR